MACIRLKDHPLFAQIIGEHEIILRRLDRLPTIDGVVEYVNFLFEFAEQGHHRQEELLLFSEVFKFARHREGGPMCTYFFDAQMASPPEERVKALLTQLAPQISLEMKMDPHHQEVFAANSPVKIPINEHRSGKALLEFCRAHLSQLPGSFEMILRCLELYREIQVSHIKKEETCFFHMCVAVLPSTELDRIGDVWMRAAKISV